jgi:hypothetical protein
VAEELLARLKSELWQQLLILADIMQQALELAVAVAQRSPGSEQLEKHVGPDDSGRSQCCSQSLNAYVV